MGRPQRKPAPRQSADIITVGLDADLLARVRAYKDRLGDGEFGRLSLRQALAAVVKAGLDAKGVP